ncbi:hypothetical protein GQ457_06G026290 [Hibiscus cannabinus]
MVNPSLDRCNRDECGDNPSEGIQGEEDFLLSYSSIFLQAFLISSIFLTCCKILIRPQQSAVKALNGEDLDFRFAFIPQKSARVHLLATIL